MPSSGVQTCDRKSTRLNSSHLGISYAVFCLKKKENRTTRPPVPLPAPPAPLPRLPPRSPPRHDHPLLCPRPARLLSLLQTTRCFFFKERANPRILPLSPQRTSPV